MDRQNLWKARPLKYGSQAAKIARAERQEAHRRRQRNDYLERIRDIQTVDDEEEFVDTPEDRAARLIKWKEERDLKKKIEAENKRPVFKIGVPHHKFYSPTAGDVKPHIHKRPKAKTPIKALTIATQRRLEAKAAAATLAVRSGTSNPRNRDRAQPSTSKAVTPPQPRLTRSRKKAQEIPLAPDNYSFKIPDGLSAIPLFGEFIYPDTESAILDFNLNSNSKVNDIDEKDQLNFKKNDTSSSETKKSSSAKHLKSMSPAGKSSEQELNLMKCSDSSQDSDSSIESIELRLSSQSEPSKIDEISQSEDKMESGESDEVQIATRPKELNISKYNMKGVKSYLRNRNKSPSANSTAEVVQPRMTRSRKNAENNVSTREIPSGKDISYPKTAPAISPSDLDDTPGNKQVTENDVTITKESNMNIIETDESPEKLIQKDSAKLTPIESGQSIQASDSSIESIVLQMSSQTAAPQMDETSLQATEAVSMNIDSDEPPRSFSPVPAQYSPFIVTSRGKSSARKEQKQRLSLHKSGSSDDIPTKDTVLQNLNISVEEEERTAQYYKFLVQREENRLKDLCTVWEKIQGQEDTTEDGHYMINQAIGQTNLLIKKKFDRFRGLVWDCETGKGEQLVCCRDLQGFWMIVEREIKDCMSRFAKLEELKARNWIEEEEPEAVIVKKKPTVMKKKKIAAKSNMRSFIEAARKKKMAPEAPMDEDEPEKPKIEDLLPSITQRKQLPIYPGSPHSRSNQTPRTDRTSLLKLVQLSQSAKRITQNSFAILKVSQKCKTPEVQHDKSITYVNSEQKPGRGILKKSEDVQKTDAKLNKSTNKVNFNDTVDMTEEVEEVVDIESNSRSLAAALARIETLDFGEDDETRVNKKLEFDDDDDNDGRTDVLQEAPVLASSQILDEDSKEALEAPSSAEDDEVKRKIQISAAIIPAITVTEATPPCNTHQNPEHLENKEAAIPAFTITKTMPQCKENLSPQAAGGRGARKTRGKSRKSGPVDPTVSINIIEATPVAETSRNNKNQRTEEMEIESVDSMPAPRLLRKGRGRRTNTGEPAEIKNTTGKKKSHENVNPDDIIAVPELPVRRQTRSHSILAASTAEKKCHTPRPKKSLNKKTIEHEELKHHSDDLGDKENVSGLENRRPQTPTTPSSSIDLNCSQLRRSARKSVKFVLEDDCTACKPVPLTPRSTKIRMSFLGNDDEKTTFQPLPNGDLMAFDSPIPRRSRLRRSSTK